MSQSAADNPGVIVFPPLLFGGAMLAGIVLHVLIPLPFHLPTWPARVAGVMLIVGSGWLAKAGQDVMRRAGTNVRPNQPSTAIVSDGPFRYSRNPLYLASLGLYLGIALAIPALWPVLLLVLVLPVLRWGIIAREERYLATKFGGEYLQYRSRVRRWL